jgi:hypothetical protein
VSQLKSLDQMHQECCDELRRLDPGGGRPGPAVSMTGGGEWLLLVGPTVTVVWGIITWFLIWGPLRADLKKHREDGTKSRDAMDGLRDSMASLQEALDKDLAERRMNPRSAYPGPATVKLIEKLKPTMQQGLAEVRGKVTPEVLDGAHKRLCAVLEDLGAPSMHAEEVAQIVIDIVGKPLLASPAEPTPAPNAPLPS